MDLFPTPRSLVLTGGAGPPVATPVEHEDGPSLAPQGFRLTVGEGDAGRVVLRSADALGRRYGEDVLDQLRAAHPGGLPALDVDDQPDLVERAFHLDISRDRVPRMDDLRGLVELLRRARFTQLQLYTEHTFAYAAHPEVWAA